MNPYRLKDVFNYLTSNNQLLKRKLKLGTDEIPIPPKRDDVKTIEAINRFNKANPRVDTTNLKPLSVKHSNVRQSNVNEPNEGVIQGAFDTATREAQSEGFPAPNYEKFKARYLKRNMKADGGMLVQSSDDGSRPGYKEDKKNIYPREKGTDKYKLSEAYKKSITPKGYVDVQDLIELIDNPKLTQNVFTQARKFEKNPKKYPGRKNYVYNKIISLLGEKKVSRGGDSPYAQKIFYKKPTKKQIDTLTNFIDSKILETGTVKNLEILDKEFGKLFQGKKPKGFFTNTLTLDKARNVFLKKYGIKATDSQLARAMMRLGQVYDGQLFQNDINISKNKTAANFIDKSFNEIDMFSGWRSASYDAALDDISKNMPKKAGDVRNFKTTLNDYIKQNYPKVFKKYDINEIFSVTTSSVRGSYPYSYFVDLTKSDVNQKLLANFQGQASKAEGQIQKAIANYRRTGNVKFYEEALSVANKFNTVNRKKFLSDERVIKAGGANAVKLEIGSQQQIKDKIGFANEYYKQNNLDKWKSQGIDIDAHTGKSGYVKTLGTKTVPKGVSTFTDLVQDGEVNEKQFKSLLAKIGCPGLANGGRAGFDVGTNCQMKGSQLINSGMKNASPAQVKNFAAFLNRAGNIGRGIMKFGIIPEAMFAAADSLVRMGMGDTFKEAGLKATDYLLPGDQTKAAEISKVSRIFGDETGELVGRTIDYKNQLAKIQSLEDQKANFENLSGGGEFDYIGDLTGDVNNVEKQLIQARNDLDNKFKISEAEQLFAESKQDDAYDASKATSFLSNLKRKYRDSSDNLSDVETLAAPEKTQMQLNLNMLPNFTETMKDPEIKKDLDYVNLPEKNIREYFTTQGTPEEIDSFLQYQKDLKDAYSLNNLSNTFGKEQVYGTQGTFGGEPVDMTNYKPNPNRFEGFKLGMASGGIASLTDTIPPKSGPTPHGLPSLMKRGIKIKE